MDSSLSMQWPKLILLQDLLVGGSCKKLKRVRPFASSCHISEVDILSLFFMISLKVIKIYQGEGLPYCLGLTTVPDLYLT